MPTAPFGIAAANHPVKTADRRGDALKAAGVPPKTIRLRGHWPVRIEPAIDKKQAVIAVMGRTSQARVKGAMARIRSDLLFDILAPAGQSDRPLARRLAQLVQTRPRNATVAAP